MFLQITCTGNIYLEKKLDFSYNLKTHPNNYCVFGKPTFLSISLFKKYFETSLKSIGVGLYKDDI